VFGERFTRREVFDDVRFHGMTDRAIVRGGLARVGLPADDAAIDAVCTAYVAALAEEMPRSEGFRVYPGVREVLAAVGGRPGVAVGLGTGNLREGARLKLERADLAHHFAFGGFGCDHEERPAIVRIAAERGAAHLGVPLGACRVVVIGDTPRDVAAAQAIGAAAIAVETGGIGRDELARAGADRIFADLAAVGVVDALLAERGGTT
jgi:phosphoglycolate phosphatase-like HAD superfamily hydrolase